MFEHWSGKARAPRYTVEAYPGIDSPSWWNVRNAEKGWIVCECATDEHAERIATALTILDQLEELADTYRRQIARGHE